MTSPALALSAAIKEIKIQHKKNTQMGTGLMDLRCAALLPRSFSRNVAGKLHIKTHKAKSTDTSLFQFSRIPDSTLKCEIFQTAITQPLFQKEEQQQKSYSLEDYRKFYTILQTVKEFHLHRKVITKITTCSKLCIKSLHV